MSNNRYPAARRGDTVDDYHGTKVADPYRWLEEPDSEETRAWIAAQNRLTDAFLQEAPLRDQIRQRLRKLWDYERYSLPYREGGRYFFRKNDGLQNQSVLYAADNFQEEPRLLIDPNLLSKDGTIALQSYAPSPDGKYLAYALSHGGSDWLEWHVLDLDTGKEVGDVIKWSKFSGAAWTHDGKGFFYSAYDAPEDGQELEAANYFQKLYYHRIGDRQDQDALVYHRPDHKEWGFSGRVTDDGRYLVITVWKGTDDTSLIFYKDLSRSDAEVVELISAFEHEYEFIDNDGEVFWFKTDRDASRGRVIAIDLNRAEPEHYREIIPEAPETLQGIDVVGSNFLALYLKDAHSQLRVFDLEGAPQRIVKLPQMGTVHLSDGKRGDSETFFSFTSFTTPSAIYRYDVRTDKSAILFEPTVDFKSDDYVTKQVFYTSRDGTRVPMFITHQKGIKIDGQLPTYLYGYGGFDISLTPEFSVSQAVWMELGGVFAVANIRGGGEYGEDWHAAGTKTNKQNVFDDFIAAAQWLVDNGYTRPSRLAIGGRSNGGLLVGACMIQRPDLFGAVDAGVGVMDMLRFHKFTIGWAWTDDYGSPENPEEFLALRAYSPLHNLQPGNEYPATLITTADHDDRVVPAHSFKFAAALQHAQGGAAPTLIRIETRAGHGAGKPTEKLIDEIADRYAFITRVLGVSG